MVEFIVGLMLGINLSIAGMLIWGYNLEKRRDERLNKALKEYNNLLDGMICGEDQEEDKYEDLKRYKS